MSGEQACVNSERWPQEPPKSSNQNWLLRNKFSEEKIIEGDSHLLCVCVCVCYRIVCVTFFLYHAIAIV